jgi:hypothetical protein
MARVHPPTRTSDSDARKRAAAAVSHAHERAIDPIKDQLFAIDKHEPITYRPNRNFHEDAVEAREPAGDFGGGEISQSFKTLQERLMGLSNGLSILAQRMTAVLRPEPPSTVEKGTAGQGASSAVARALLQLDRNVEVMQVQIDGLTERIVL